MLTGTTIQRGIVEHRVIGVKRRFAGFRQHPLVVIRPAKPRTAPTRRRQRLYARRE